MRNAVGVIILAFLLSVATCAQTNTFHFRLNGTEMGVEQYELAKTADGYRLTGKLQMKVPVPTELAHEQTLSSDLGFQRYKLTVAGGAQTVEAWREAGKLQMKVAAGSQEKANTAQVAAGHLVLLDNMISGHFQVLLNLLGGKPPVGTWTFLVPQTLSAIPGKVTLAGEDSATLDGKRIRTQKYTIELANVLEEMWAEAGTNRLMRVYVPLQKAEFVREGFALVAPEPKKEAPAAYIEREVQFPSAGFKFPATLCLPAKATGKMPLLVFVHGSGSSAGDRDETIGPNKPFRDLAHGLAASGIATLRYEKRTYAFARQLDPKTMTVDDETMADAVAALQFARTLPEADPQRLFVLGHSQGATFAPFIAERAQARGAILMAAAERPLDEIVPEQIAFGLKLGGKSDQEIAAEVDKLTKDFARVRSGEAKDDEIVFHATARYWRDYLSRDPQAALRNLKAPVLVLQGGKDIQVRKADYDLALKALATKPPKLREAHFFPDLNHLFLRVEGEPTGAEYGRAGTVPDEVIQTIAAWVKRQ